VYKILISDGYVNTGLVGVPQIKDDYAGFYNSTIGIGDECDYDKSLLQTLTNEFSERSCFNSDEMKDQVIDSVFTNVSKVAENIKISTKDAVVSRINNSDDFENDGIISNNVKLTNKSLFIVNTDECSIEINGIPSSYLVSGGYDIVDGPVITSFNNLLLGEVQVISKTNDAMDTVSIVLNLLLKPSVVYKSNSMEKSFRKIQNFIDISNDILNLDLGDTSSFMMTKQTIKNIKILHGKTANLIKYVKELNNSDQNNYIIGVIHKFKSSLEPYIRKDGYRHLNNISLATPLRMCRAQTSSGSYAFAGRQVSMGYSIGINDLVINDTTDEQTVNSPVNSPVLTSPSNSSNTLYTQVPPPPPIMGSWGGILNSGNTPPVINSNELYPGAQSSAGANS
jgi:hypothetical protein